MGKCREEFEDYMLKSGYPRDALSRSDYYDCYNAITIDTMYSAWKAAWKASRESMKAVKLPDKYEVITGNECYHFNLAIDECKDAITSAGYKVE